MTSTRPGEPLGMPRRRTRWPSSTRKSPSMKSTATCCGWSWRARPHPGCGCRDRARCRRVGGARGHRVVAVEPTTELRAHGQRIHADSGIDWVDDILPDLALSQHTGQFDAVFVTAVWMHLDAEERRHAMARIAGLLVPGGRFFVNLRHRPCARWPPHVRRVRC
ncbi:class I SAM-dependent methyltransferase [Streptomyces sp. NPDC086766]|uniref:class I SAM-dependent methyltransferase n=1 Tax=Streptomyces sp. NPDC086766 TaxID=3365754 RepID=UPI003825B186